MHQHFKVDICVNILLHHCYAQYQNEWIANNKIYLPQTVNALRLSFSLDLLSLFFMTSLRFNHFEQRKRCKKKKPNRSAIPKTNHSRKYLPSATCKINSLHNFRFCALRFHSWNAFQSALVTSLNFSLSFSRSLISLSMCMFVPLVLTRQNNNLFV